jgi:hypothetical protein
MNIIINYSYSYIKFDAVFHVLAGAPQQQQQQLQRNTYRLEYLS